MKWNSKFNKPRCYPSNIGGHTKNSDIAVAFSESFSNVYFDSYFDSSSYVKCLEEVHSYTVANINMTNIQRNLSITRFTQALSLQLFICNRLNN